MERAKGGSDLASNNYNNNNGHVTFQEKLANTNKVCAGKCGGMRLGYFPPPKTPTALSQLNTPDKTKAFVHATKERSARG